MIGNSGRSSRRQVCYLASLVTGRGMTGGVRFAFRFALSRFGILIELAAYGEMRDIGISFMRVGDETDERGVAYKGHEHNKTHDKGEEFRVCPRSCFTNEKVEVVNQKGAVKENDVNGSQDERGIDIDSLNGKDEAKGRKGREEDEYEGTFGDGRFNAKAG